MACVLMTAAVFVASLTGVAATSAKPGYVTFSGERVSQLTLKGTHGFDITITRVNRRVELSASKENSAAVYVVHSPNTPSEGIKATFPGLGRIAMRFDPLGHARRTPPICGGSPSVRQDGIFRGLIRFRGEQGFTRVRAVKALGFSYRMPKESCKGKGHTGKKSLPDDYVSALAKVPAGWLGFVASKSPEGSEFAGSTSYFASEQKAQHGMRSSRFATAFSRSGEGFKLFGPASQPESATVSPPDPFTGTASFQNVLDPSTQWTGDLAVDLPGVGIVQLEGPRFRSQLCFDRHCVGSPDM